MRTMPKIILILWVIINPIRTYAQDDQNSKTLEAFKQAQQEYASRSNEEKKLQFGTYELLRLAEAADTSEEANQKFKDILRIDKSLKADSKDRVTIMVHSNYIFDVIEFLQSSDSVVVETYINYPYVLCKIHPKKLRALAAISSVLTIQRNVEGQTNSIKN